MVARRLAPAACHALADILGAADLPQIWIEEQQAIEHGPFPKFWLLVWWIGRGAVPTPHTKPVAMLEDVLAQADDPRVWHRSEA